MSVPRTGVPWSDEHSSWEEQQAAGERTAGGDIYFPHTVLHVYIHTHTVVDACISTNTVLSVYIGTNTVHPSGTRSEEHTSELQSR